MLYAILCLSVFHSSLTHMSSILALLINVVTSSLIPSRVAFHGYHFGSESSSQVNKNCRFVLRVELFGTNL